MVSVPSGRRRSALFAPESVATAPASIARLIADATTPGKFAWQFSHPYPLGGRAKRAFDVIVSATVLAILGPLMLVVASLVSLQVGPALVGQRRVGFGGKHFTSYRFRTARARAPHVGCLGSILRQSGLDELPQLLNVLKGDMSLVGPQAVTPEEFAGSAGVRHYAATRPGITGLWQVQTDAARGRMARSALDRLYVSKWSLGLDLALLSRLVIAPLKQTR
jgi:exopolysaccharide production protein ExoY